MEAMLILCTYMIRIIMNIRGGIDGFRVIGFEKQEKNQ
jgi:hypothetical protein